MSYKLNPRQRAFFKHKCNIYSVATAINSATGRPGDETYTLVASAIPCYYEYTPNVSDPTEAIGRIKRATIFTTDTIHMPSGVTVMDAWLTKNVTLLSNGRRSPSYGEVHQIMGAPNEKPDDGNRHPNSVSVMAMTLEKPPSGMP